MYGLTVKVTYENLLNVCLDKYEEDEQDGSQPLFHMTMDVEGIG